MDEKALYSKDEFFEVEMLQDGSAEFDAEAVCTCTDTSPTCSSNSSNTSV